MKRAKRTLMHSGLQHSMVRVWSSSSVAMLLVSRVKEKIEFFPIQATLRTQTGSEQVELFTGTTLPALFVHAAHSLSQRATVR